MEASKFEAAAQHDRSFHEEFRNLTGHIDFFKKCYEKSRNLISEIQSVFKNDLNSTSPGTELITNNERAQLDEFINKRASVLVVGQTNSGKSSLINELLGSSYLPTSEVPCTSRIVRIRYSDKNFLTVKDWTGETKIQETRFKKNIPKAEIALGDDSKRGDKAWTHCIVEVGLNNPLLQGGHLEFVDAPGMSENEVLDSIVKECVHGILQILIYVIDGNSSLRTQDREFLYGLKPEIRGIPIFFVCNKIDFDEKAAEFDRDDDEDDSYLESENQLKAITEKKTRIFSALVRSHIIERELDEVDRCDFFHGVSTREVKKARRKQNADVLKVHTEAFERMKRCFLTFASESIVRHVSNVASLLGAIQQRIFDFYISRQFITLQMSDIRAVIQKLRRTETNCFQKMRGYVFENGDKIESILTTAIDNKEDEILGQAEDMEFASIPIADVVHRNEIVNQYKGQIQKMVLIAALNISLKAVTHTVRVVTLNVKQQLERSLRDASETGGLTGRLVEQQIRNVDILSYSYCASNLINMAVVKDYSLMTLTYKTFDPPKSFLADVLSVFKGTTVDKSWKRKVAKNILDNVDRSKLRERIIGALLDNLHESHESFKTNLDCIETLSEKAYSQTQQQEQTVGEYGPDFAELLCLNDALLKSLENPSLRLGHQIGTGKRSTVYACYSCKGRFSEMKLVANQPRKGASNLMSYAIQHALKRLEGNHPNVMSPVSLVLIDNRLTLLLPRLHTDLYSALANNTLQATPVLVRITILKQMAGACKFCRENGLQLIDPRITNVMLDEHNQAFLNICKPRDDSICYPDNLAPFHVYMAPPPLIYTSKRVLQFTTQHDVYALGIMGWLLAIGKYRRPPFANTSDVTEVYNAVSGQNTPDLSLIPQEADKEGFTELISDCLGETCNIFMLEKKLSFVIERYSKDAQSTMGTYV